MKFCLKVLVWDKPWRQLTLVLVLSSSKNQSFLYLLEMCMTVRFSFEAKYSKETQLPFLEHVCVINRWSLLNINFIYTRILE